MAVKSHGAPTASNKYPTVETFLRIPEVLRIVGMGRSSLYAAIKRGDFPKQIKIGERSSAWRSSQISEWQQKQIEARRGQE